MAINLFGNSLASVQAQAEQNSQARKALAMQQAVRATNDPLHGAVAGFAHNAATRLFGGDKPSAEATDMALSQEQVTASMLSAGMDTRDQVDQAAAIALRAGNIPLAKRLQEYGAGMSGPAKLNLTERLVYDQNNNSSVIQLFEGKPFIGGRVVEWNDSRYTPTKREFTDGQVINRTNALKKIEPSENLLGQLKVTGAGANSIFNAAKQEDLGPLGVNITRIANELRLSYIAAQKDLPIAQKFMDDPKTNNMFIRQAIELMNDAGQLARQMDGDVYQYSATPFSVPELVKLRDDAQTKSVSERAYRAINPTLTSAKEKRFGALNEDNIIFNEVLANGIEDPETYVNDLITEGTLAPDNEGRLISGLSWMSQNPEISSLLVQQDKHPKKGGRWKTEWKDYLSGLEKIARRDGSTAESFAPYWAALDAEEFINSNRDAPNKAISGRVKVTQTDAQRAAYKAKAKKEKEAEELAAKNATTTLTAPNRSVSRNRGL